MRALAGVGVLGGEILEGGEAVGGGEGGQRRVGGGEAGCFGDVQVGWFWRCLAGEEKAWEGV